MTVKELIDKLKEHPPDMNVCIGVDIQSELDLTVLECGTRISQDETLDNPYLSIW